MSGSMAGRSEDGIVQNVTILNSLRSAIGGMKGKRSGILFSVAVSVAVSSVLLFYFPVAPIIYVAIALLSFLLPYFMGLRKAVPIIVYGLGLMLVLSFVFAGAYTHAVYLAPASVSQDSGHNTTAGYYFGQSGVSPLQGTGSTAFTFSARFYHPSSGQGSIPVYIEAQRLFSNGVAVNATMAPVSNVSLPNGEVLTTYSYSATLPSNEIFLLQFKSNVSGVWVSTFTTLAPRTISQQGTYFAILYPSVIVVFISIGTLFAGIALIVLLLRFNRTRREQIAKQRLERVNKEPEEKTVRHPRVQQPSATSSQSGASKKEKFICTSCGAEVSREDTECPKCGEKFD